MHNTTHKQYATWDTKDKEKTAAMDSNKQAPSDEAKLQEDFKKQCEMAARALAESDVLLLVTGAGFSADSGLAVYSDVAKVQAYEGRCLDYSDVCQPHWIETEPEIFYGFWGQCFNDYRKTKPHKGYDIIARWRDDKKKARDGKVDQDIQSHISKKMESKKPPASEEVQSHAPYDVTDGPPGAFYVFTSNVDAHFYDQFNAHEIHDCHGNVELWQCSSPECDSGIWRAPIQHDFLVDTHTMLAPQYTETSEDRFDLVEEPMASHSENDGSNVPHIGQTKGIDKRDCPLRYMPVSKDKTGWHLDEGSNWPKCGHCKNLARPAILMFGDFAWKYDEPQYERWKMWKEALLDLYLDLKVCIVEIGCGKNVPTCRWVSEKLVEDLIQRGGSAELVRINLDFPSAPEGSIAEMHTIPIKSRGLQAIEQIDEIYSSQSASKEEC